MARYLSTEEDDWDKLISGKLREIDDNDSDSDIYNTPDYLINDSADTKNYIPDSLPTNANKDKIKYSIKSSTQDIAQQDKEQ